jgi:hypothetical protein
MIQTVVANRNDQIIKWGTGIIASLVAGVVYLMMHHLMR